MNTEITVDTEFENVIPPLTEEEYKQLESNILEEGRLLTPIIVWNGTVIDGHNRYKIAMCHPEIEIVTTEKQFSNRDEAIAWICDNQLGRRNLTSEQKMDLIGKRYNSGKAPRGGDRKSEEAKSKSQNDILISDGSLKEKIARECGVSTSYVARAALFTEGIDAAEMVSPGFRKDIINGTLKVNQSDVIAIRKVPVEKRRQMVQGLKNPKSKEERKKDTEQLQQLSEISDEMVAPHLPVSMADHCSNLKGIIAQTEDTCDNLFRHFPELLTDSACKSTIDGIMDMMIEYALEIKAIKPQISEPSPEKTENDSEIA